MSEKQPLARMLSGLAAIPRTLRTAIFGVTRPRRAVRDSMMRSAEELDPKVSDPRAFGPAEPPEIVETKTGDPGH